MANLLPENTDSRTGEMSVPANAPSYYVAIGASAGGLEALQEFFQQMPVDSDVAFIIVQHLSPDFKSMMDELLGRETSMPVYHATDGMYVEANSLYLIPPRKNMLIAEGRLQLQDQFPQKGINFPIDIFFRALAEDQHQRSIGVVLSGTGSDGSRGIQAIKEVNGLVIVQSPDNAKFDGMPCSAINSGYADVVLDVKEIPKKIVSFITHPLVALDGESLVEQIQSSESALGEVFRLLKTNCQIDFTMYKSATVARRIERRIGIHQLNSLNAYLQLLLKSPKEVDLLSKDMLIGVTRFFRDPEYFHELENKVIPDIVKLAKKNEPIRVWVAGCSTGEEAYSLAIVFSEVIERFGASHVVKIFATDADPEAIAEASAGRFSLNVSEDLTQERLQKYFQQDEGCLVIDQKIRQMVIFANHELINDPPFSNTHLVTCRNVLIYFQAQTQRQVLSMFHFSLRKNGYLFLGPSESLGELRGFFECIHERGRIFQKVISTSVALAHERSKLSKVQVRPPKIETLMIDYHRKNSGQISNIVLDAFLEFYVPPCILVNDTHQVLHVFGDVSKYVRPPRSGAFSAEIRDVVSDQLSVPVTTALYRATKSDSSVVYEDVYMQSPSGGEMSINLRVCSIKKTSVAKECFLILFEPQTAKHMPVEELASQVIVYNANDQKQQRIVDLENQLKNKQEHLQVTVEELETTNEELQSSNQELLAANEELQSTNEELQSLNEELYSVNSEYHNKIGELVETNADLDNIMKSTDLGIIFLDDALLIRKYTPAATREFNLMPTDINRPFHHISNNLKYDGLLADLSKCVETKKPIEREILVANEKRSLLIKICPYISPGKQFSGVVLVVNDVSYLRQIERSFKETYHRLRQDTGIGLLEKKKPHKILIVDDQEIDREFIRNILEQSTSQTYIFFEASNTSEAYALLKKETFDACIIDYRLDGTDAFEFLESFSAQAFKVKKPPFILVSELMSKDLYEQSIRLGIYDAISKDQLSTALLDRAVRHIIQLQVIETSIDSLE